MVRRRRRSKAGLDGKSWVDRMWWKWAHSQRMCVSVGRLWEAHNLQVVSFLLQKYLCCRVRRRTVLDITLLGAFSIVNGQMHGDVPKMWKI